MDPVLKNAGREARVALLLFGVAFLWIVGVSFWLGYGRRAEDVGYVLGFPDWIFWGVVLPWIACLATSVWFGLRFMKDDDFGPEGREGVDD